MSPAVFELHELEPSGGAPSEIIVTGEIDASNAAEFERSVTTLPGARPVILELTSLQYLDSAGYAALDRLLAQSAVLFVIAPQSLIHKAAELMDLPFHADADAARRCLRAGKR